MMAVSDRGGAAVQTLTEGEEGILERRERKRECVRSVLAEEEKREKRRRGEGGNSGGEGEEGGPTGDS